jgi:hypothetical protein
MQLAFLQASSGSVEKVDLRLVLKRDRREPPDYMSFIPMCQGNRISWTVSLHNRPLPDTMDDDSSEVEAMPSDRLDAVWEYLVASGQASA